MVNHSFLHTLAFDDGACMDHHGELGSENNILDTTVNLMLQHWRLGNCVYKVNVRPGRGSIQTAHSISSQLDFGL